MIRPLVCVLAALMLSGCNPGNPEAQSDSSGMTVGVGVPVPAAAETEAVGTLEADAADDPEIWVDPRDPSRGVIFGTDKKAGLYVYDLSGKVLQFLPEGLLNNVDLRGDFMAGGKSMVLVGASDRARMGVALFLLDPDTLQLTKWADVPVDVALPYGFCMGRMGDETMLVLNTENGVVVQLSVADNAGAPAVTELRRFEVGSQTEGCVVDDAAGHLYVGEEARGIWRYGLDPAAGDERIQFAGAPSDMVTPDVEGLTLLQDGEARYLIASSQGDSAFAVWRVDGEAPQYSGRFSVVAGNGVDAVTGTDGVAALGGQVGGFSEGLIVMQDDLDTDGETNAADRERQNYKLVGWAEVKAALGL